VSSIQIYLDFGPDKDWLKDINIKTGRRPGVLRGGPGEGSPSPVLGSGAVAPLNLF